MSGWPITTDGALEPDVRFRGIGDAPSAYRDGPTLRPDQIKDIKILPNGGERPEAFTLLFPIDFRR